MVPQKVHKSETTKAKCRNKVQNTMKQVNNNLPKLKKNSQLES